MNAFKTDTPSTYMAPNYQGVVEIAFSLTNMHRKDGDIVNVEQITDCVLQRYPDWCKRREAKKFVAEVHYTYFILSFIICKT